MLANLLIPPTLFFALGFFAHLIRSDLKFPGDVGKAASIYLLVGIGLRGGMELAKAELADAAAAVVAALVLGVALPIGILDPAAGRQDRQVERRGGRCPLRLGERRHLPDSDRISRHPADQLRILPAHHAGDHGTAGNRHRPAAGAGRRGQRRFHRRHPAPAARGLHQWQRDPAFRHDPDRHGRHADEPRQILPLFDRLFTGVLCLFLLEMGLEAAKRMGEFRRVGLFLTAFGIRIPLLGGTVGVLVGHYLLGFSLGGTTLVAVLTANSHTSRCRRRCSWRYPRPIRPTT